MFCSYLRMKRCIQDVKEFRAPAWETYDRPTMHSSVRVNAPTSAMQSSSPRKRPTRWRRRDSVAPHHQNGPKQSPASQARPSQTPTFAGTLQLPTLPSVLHALTASLRCFRKHHGPAVTAVATVPSPSHPFVYFRGLPCDLSSPPHHTNHYQHLLPISSLAAHLLHTQHTA